MPTSIVDARLYRGVRGVALAALGLVMLRAAAAHLANPYYFLGAVHDYALVPPGWAAYIAAALPFLELVCAVCMLAGIATRPASVAAAALFALFVAAQVVVMSRGEAPSCGCFGAAASRPIGWVSIGTAGGCLMAALLGTIPPGTPVRPADTTPAGRGGTTLAELLVVLGILGVLAGLTAGAVQRARAAAARTQCANNLRQLAVALHKYHDTEGRLPAGRNDYRLADRRGWDPESGISWAAHLLPGLDQPALWERFRSGAADASAVRVPTLLCPADVITGTPGGVTSDGRPRPVSAGMSYVGVSGSGKHARPLEQDGVLYRGSATRFSEILDGPANTLLLAERHGAKSRRTGVWGEPRGGGHAAPVAHYLSAAQSWDFTTSGRCPDRPGRFEPGRPADVCDLIHYWSSHPGGANFAFCDGSVRFLRYEADSVLPALATRAGGEIAVIPD